MRGSRPSTYWTYTERMELPGMAVRTGNGRRSPTVTRWSNPDSHSLGKAALGLSLLQPRLPRTGLAALNVAIVRRPRLSLACYVVDRPAKDLQVEAVRLGQAAQVSVELG